MSGPPERLAALHRAMGRQLRAAPAVGARGFDTRGVSDELEPLLAPPPAGTPPQEARVALYRSQHWQRLFRALQEASPRATRVVGAFAFNQLALAWLDAHPPASHDLGDCADGFASALLGALGGAAWPRPLAVPVALREPLTEALRLDEAVRRAFEAPWRGLWRLSPAQLAGLLERRLALAPGLTVLRTRHALLDATAIPEGAPVRLAAPVHLVVARSEQGTAVHTVLPTLARLLTLSRSRPLGEAIAALEASCEPEVVAALAEHLPAHIQQALERGWWVGVQAGRSSSARR
jgi:hypothetical protein